MKLLKNAWLLAVVTMAIAPFYYAGAEPGALLKDTKIAVVSETKDGMFLVTMNADGSNPLRLNGDETTSMSPSWSPDGNKIAFMSTEDGKPEIYVINADGTDKKQLTNTKPVDDFFGLQYPNYPSWSPDGKKIVYVSRPQPDHKTPELYVIDTDGTNPTRLTQSKVVPDSWIIVGLGPVAWSPDGKKIVYAAIKDDRLGIHVINADGTNPVSLATANGSCASWSPDGKRIVFMSQEAGDKPSGIRLMDADGSNLIALPNKKATAQVNPSWLPDGKKIALSADGEEGPGIYTMNVDGTQPTRIRYVIKNADGTPAPLQKGGLDVAVWSPLLR
jgi:Tol biopolymer transport system component